jgi:hypothetical protein
MSFDIAVACRFIWDAAVGADTAGVFSADAERGLSALGAASLPAPSNFVLLGLFDALPVRGCTA